MKKAFRLICFPWHQVLLRQGIPVAIIYGFLLPYQMRFLQIGDSMMMAREIFRSSQLLLALLMLWPLFCFFLPVYHPGTQETLQALRHPMVSCVLELMIMEQIICVPLYSWICFVLPDYRRIVWILVFQSFCLSMAFAFLLCLFHSPIMNIAGGLIYICISIPFADTQIPILLRPGRLFDGFGMTYWVVHILLQVVIIAVMIGCRYLTTIHKFRC